MGWLKDVADTASQGANNVADAGANAADNVAAAGQQAADAITAAGEAAAAAVTNAARGASNSIAEEARRAGDAIAIAARRAADAVADVGRRAADSISREGRQFAATVQTRVLDSGSSIHGATPLPKPKPNRLLSDKEKAVARQVFEGTLPYDKIWLSAKNARGGFVTVPGFHKGTYVIHVGNDVFDDMTDRSKGQGHDPLGHIMTADSFLIHELTHVWQACHWSNHTAYILDYVKHMHEGDDMYAYELGKPWRDYHAEQQAQIVQDWYNNAFVGLNDGRNAERETYIVNNIRKGDNNA